MSQVEPDMASELSCPQCQSWLLKRDLDGIEFNCPTCDGHFIRGSETRQKLLAQVTPRPDASVVPFACPDCRGEMIAATLLGAELRYCASCWGSWMPAATATPSTSGSQGIGRALLFGLSLPERTLRSAVGLAAGAVKGTAGVLVPQCFQSSKTYEIVVTNSLRLLTEDVGGVKGQPADKPAVENYVARKTVGNFVDLAGIASLHLSPLWLLAIVSDVAYGTKTYVVELAEELKQQGLIDQNSTIHRVDDLLDAVQKSSGNAASLFDTPPLNAEDLKKTLKETRDSLKNADVVTLLPQSEIQRYWQELKDLSRKENVSLLGMSGAVTLHTIRKIGAVGQGTLTGVFVAGGLFNRHILGHYGEAIETYRTRGLYSALREDSAPYIEAVWNNYSPNRSTWTEELISGRAIGSLFRKVAGFFKAQPAPAPLPAPPAETTSEGRVESPPA